MRKKLQRRDIRLALTSGFRGKETVRVNYCSRAGNDWANYVKCFTKSQVPGPAPQSSSTAQLRQAEATWAKVHADAGSSSLGDAGH